MYAPYTLSFQLFMEVLYKTCLILNSNLIPRFDYEMMDRSTLLSVIDFSALEGEDMNRSTTPGGTEEVRKECGQDWARLGDGLAHDVTVLAELHPEQSTGTKRNRQANASKGKRPGQHWAYSGQGVQHMMLLFLGAGSPTVVMLAYWT